MAKKIIIIDDDVDLVEAMRITLENAGFEVIDAQDGKKGVEKIKKESPDLVILDVMMGSHELKRLGAGDIKIFSLLMNFWKNRSIQIN